MMIKIFDGRKKAEEILGKIKRQIKIKNLRPKLVSFYLPEDEGSALYTKIKSEKAKEVGIEFEGVPIQSIEETVQLIKQASGDPAVHGILVQHPSGGVYFKKAISARSATMRNKNRERKLMEVYSNEQWQKMVSAIAKEKDVDGLRDDSPFLPATIKAILYILDGAKVHLNEVKIAVVGARGLVGKKLVKALRDRGVEVIEVDQVNNRTIKQWNKIPAADVVISATGVPGLIKADMIKPGATVLDVGSPKGDVDFESVFPKASFITPVPGGVGPMTVACLLENVVESVITHTQPDSWKLQLGGGIRSRNASKKTT